MKAQFAWIAPGYICAPMACSPEAAVETVLWFGGTLAALLLYDGRRVSEIDRHGHITLWVEP